ncbi:MAG TPA: HlyD family efflux transporter periplasmic adaptor subunit [Chitinophagaceae bacterium]|nr:HlyD family efflux transporter periplasmic adaptor subunit [Chitinophagaceae bacterium]
MEKELIPETLPVGQWQSVRSIYRFNRKSSAHYWIYGLLILLFLILFLPWTQHIRARGTVTTLRQEQRPQQVNAVIPGRITQWHVREGDQVKAGDTLVQLAEIKDEYFDPNLLERTREQLDAKTQARDFYQSKANLAVTQVQALTRALDLKLSQLRSKLVQLELRLQSDSMESVAAGNDLSIASRQLARQKVLFDSGLVSRTQLEQRSQYHQQALAKKAGADNKLAATRQDRGITQLEIAATEQDYREKIAKAQADGYQALSQSAASEGELAKLRNQYRNYQVRRSLYVVTAPQDGQVIRARKAGLGETVKEGDLLVEIVPRRVQYAVELFLRPVDLPLVSPGQRVRLTFDGFPAIVFSGWPASSYGTFGGRVWAVENAADGKGRFRILVSEDPADKPWPEALRVGTAARGMALLKTVPVWYEMWRTINGFPPDYYSPATADSKKNTSDEK